MLSKGNRVDGRGYLAMPNKEKFYKHPEFWIAVLLVAWSYYSAGRAILDL